MFRNPEVGKRNFTVLHMCKRIMGRVCSTYSAVTKAHGNRGLRTKSFQNGRSCRCVSASTRKAQSHQVAFIDLINSLTSGASLAKTAPCNRKQIWRRLAAYWRRTLHLRRHPRHTSRLWIQLGAVVAVAFSGFRVPGLFPGRHVAPNSQTE